MRIGTRSLLFGAHCVPIHTVMLAVAWWRLFGPPRGHKLWLSFLVHDLGYFGCREMDGAEGELHPALGGKLMRVFGREWEIFTAAHSRYYARRLGVPPSRLCAADKLATALEPWWLYLPRAWLSGELRYYMETGPERYPYAYPVGVIRDKRRWFANLQHHNRIDARELALNVPH
jgi:hypothetical protein